MIPLQGKVYTAHVTLNPMHHVKEAVEDFRKSGSCGTFIKILHSAQSAENVRLENEKLILYEVFFCLSVRSAQHNFVN